MLYRASIPTIKLKAMGRWVRHYQLYVLLYDCRNEWHQYNMNESTRSAWHVYGHNAPICKFQKITTSRYAYCVAKCVIGRYWFLLTLNVWTRSDSRHVRWSILKKTAVAASTHSTWRIVASVASWVIQEVQKLSCFEFAKGHLNHDRAPRSFNDTQARRYHPKRAFHSSYLHDKGLVFIFVAFKKIDSLSC